MLLKVAVLLLTNAVATFGISERLFDDEEKRPYNFGLGKRAYSYVSEYKRLPVYNFGLGKRAEAKNMYAFGLGKREDDREESADESDVEKRRDKLYDFGLGKRLMSGGYDFGLGKKALPQYSFGLGKRLGYYNFGLGKRQGKYSFGLGKRDKAYSFGLGKRYNYLPTEEDDESNGDNFNFEYKDADEEKRSSKYTDGQKFSFGLGKRESTLDDLIDADDAENLSERQIRGLHYSFGLGKRNAELPLKSFPQSQQESETRQTSKTTQ